MEVVASFRQEAVGGLEWCQRSGSLWRQQGTRLMPMHAVHQILALTVEPSKKKSHSMENRESATNLKCGDVPKPVWLRTP
jgi:hypothetical protein